MSVLCQNSVKRDIINKKAVCSLHNISYIMHSLLYISDAAVLVQLYETTTWMLPQPNAFLSTFIWNK